VTVPQDRSQPGEPVILGRVVGLFGVKGWIKVFSHTDPRSAILEHAHWRLRRGGEWADWRLAEGRQHGKSVVARLHGVEDRELAAELVGADIGIDRSELQDTMPGQFYWADLEGLQVVQRDGRPLGRVAYLLATGANDVMVVQGEREILVPFLMDTVVLDVDLSAGVIRVDWEWD